MRQITECCKQLSLTSVNEYCSQLSSIDEYMSSNMVDYTVKATDDNIRNLIKEGLDKYGMNADLNYIDVSNVTNMTNVL